MFENSGLLVALGATFLAVFAGAAVYLGRRERVSDQRRVRELLQAPPEDNNKPTWLRAAAERIGESVSHRRGWRAGIEAKLELAAWSLKPGEFTGGLIIAGFAGFLLILSLTESALLALLLGPIFVVGALLALHIAVRRRASTMHSQLMVVPMILAASLRAGHSFLQALDTVAQEIGEPTAREFNRVVSEIRLGKPTSQAMDDLGARLGSDDFKWAVMAVNIQRDVGGNLAEVLDAVGETMRERERVRGQIQVLSAEGRLSVAILAALPFLLALYMLWVRPEYISLLWQTKMGLVMLGAASGLMALGIIWMRKVVNIDV